MKKYLFLAIAAAFLFTTPAFSDSFYFLGSYVSPEGDSDIFEQNNEELTFDVDDLNGFGVTLGYDHFVGEFVNVGASVSFYEKDTTVADREFEFPNGSPILRDINLRIVPLEANVRVLPMGRDLAVIPYVGAGAGIYFWEYEEFGDFVIDRFTDPSVITGSAFSDGADFGFNIHGGVQFPISRSATITGEVKWSKVEGDLDEESFDPAFEPIDLSTFSYSAGVTFWF
jgi:opacity protein-like surface antigen